MNDPVSLCLAGRISPQVMLARLLLGGASAADIRQLLSAREDAAPLLPLLARHEQGLERMRVMAACVNHAQEANVASIAAQFDAAHAVSPEASVAGYSLGDPGLLEQATGELVAWLTATGLFAPGMDVIDLGCGFGRVAAALAPAAASVLALDVAPAMIAEGRRRFGHIPRLRFEQADGRGLSFVPAASCDLLLAADCFPYLFQARVAEAHVIDAGRVLRPGGALVILNMSYADDPGPDRECALAWAAGAGLFLAFEQARPFALWDASAMVFRARVAEPS